MSESPPTQRPDAPRRVFLAGYRGTGKTTVARLVAQRLGWRAIDADDRIEEAAASTIAELFRQQGEPSFRDLEERVVAELCQEDAAVIALGGGAVLREATRRRLSEAGPVVLLTAPAETIAERIDADATSGDRRPSLTGLPPLEEVRRLLEQREPHYRACATITVDTLGRSPEAIADKVVRFLED